MIKIEHELATETIARCIAIADQETQADLQNLNLEGFSVQYYQGQKTLRADYLLDEIQRILKRVDGLAPSTRFLLGIDRIVLCNPGLRPIEVVVRKDTPEPPPTLDSLETQSKLSKIALIYRRCKAALSLSALMIIVLDRNLNYIECNLTIKGFGVDASDVIGRRIGEVPEVDWLVAQFASAAFEQPGQSITEEFEHAPLPGLVCRFRATAEAYSNELMLTLENLTPQPWLSRY